MEPQTLLYVGTLFIAYQLVGRVGHVGSLPMLCLNFILLAARKYHKKEQADLSFRRKVCRVALIVLGIVPGTVIVFLIAVSLTPLVLVPVAVGHILDRFNNLLNNLYQRLLDTVRQEFLLPRVKQRLGTSGKAAYTDEQILEASRSPLPFLALIGLLLVTVGFILELL